MSSIRRSVPVYNVIGWKFELMDREGDLTVNLKCDTGKPTALRKNTQSSSGVTLS